MKPNKERTQLTNIDPEMTQALIPSLENSVKHLNKYQFHTHFRNGSYGKKRKDKK